MQIINKIGQYRQREFQKRTVSGITQIVVHHSAYRQDGQSDDARMRTMQNWHQTKDWSGNGDYGAGLMYHFFVSQTGAIYQINSIEDLTWTDFDNYPSLSVLVDGSFDKENPTSQQLQSLEWLLNDLSFNHPEFPATQKDVKAHCEVQATIDHGSTECCGRNLLPYVIEFRNTGKMTITQPQKLQMETVSQSPQAPQNQITSNKYYQGLLNDKNIELAVNDLIGRDKEIMELKSKLSKQDDDLNTLHLQTMQLSNQKSNIDTDQKPIPKFEVQYAQTNTSANFVQSTDQTPLFESLRGKIVSGHILEVLISLLAGLSEFAKTISFDPSQYQNPKALFSGFFTAVFSYLLIRMTPTQNKK